MNTSERFDEAVRATGLSAYGIRFPEVVVRAGEIVVLAGPNGAGKSTLCRLLVGELSAPGRIEVLGLTPDAADLKGRVGHLVKDLETLGALTSRDVLDICAAVRGCGMTYAVDLADRLGLDLDLPMARLSRGQLRRLGIVQALMHQPELVVMDDPATELDDDARLILPTLLREAADWGAAVVVTAQSATDTGYSADRAIDLQLATSPDQADSVPDQGVECSAVFTDDASPEVAVVGATSRAGVADRSVDPRLRAITCCGGVGAGDRDTGKWRPGQGARTLQRRERSVAVRQRGGHGSREGSASSCIARPPPPSSSSPWS